MNPIMTSNLDTVKVKQFQEGFSKKDSHDIYIISLYLPLILIFIVIFKLGTRL